MTDRSYRAESMSWALRDDRKLSLTAKCVWLILATRGADCRPSVPTLAADCGLSPKSERTIQRALRELQAAGWLTVTKQARANNGDAANRYTLTAPALPGVSTDTPGGSSLTPRGDVHGHPEVVKGKEEMEATPLPPAELAGVVVPSRPGGGEISISVSDEKRDGILRWLRDSGKEQPAAYLARVIAKGNLAVLIADFDAAQERPGELAWWKESAGPRSGRDLTAWERMPDNGRTGRQPELEPGFWERKNCPACGWRNLDDCAAVGRHFGHMSTSDQRATMAILAGQRAQARHEREQQERDSAGQVALPPSQSAPADPAPKRLAMCPDCQRTLRLDGGRYPEHDGNGGRRCPSSGAVSYQAAADRLRRAV